MRRLALTFVPAIVAALSLGPPAIAAAAPTLEQLSLDAYGGSAKRHHTPEVASQGRLKKGLYIATVSGTLSYWAAKYYSKPHPTKKRPWTMVCGTPEPAPAFSSAGGSGPVGLDAEFVFARPWDPQECARWPLPRKWWQFQVNAGSGWAHPAAINLTYPNPTPNPSHTYEYAISVTKPSRNVAFRLRDKATSDNYGTLHISLSAATIADCASRHYRAFGLGSEAECVAKASD